MDIGLFKKAAGKICGSKNIEIANSVAGVAKTLDKVSDSQLSIVKLIDSVDRRINGYKK